MGAFKDVAVFLDPGPESALACRLAAKLSEDWQAQLIAVFSAPVIAGNPWLRGESIGHAIDEYHEVIAAAERRGHTEFEKLCQRHRIVGEWRALHVELSEELVLHARYAGLQEPISPQPERSHGAPKRSSLRRGNPGGALFESEPKRS